MRRISLFFLLFLQTTLFGREIASYDVIGIGMACVDAFIFVDDNFLKQHVPGEKGRSYHTDPDTFNGLIKNCTISKRAVGGSAANTLRGLAKLGVSTALLSHIGRDPAGDFYQESLNRYGIKALLSTPPGFSTPEILCLITPDGQRTMRGSPKRKIAMSVDPTLFKTKLMHVEARRFDICTYVEEAMFHAKKASSLISIDLSDPGTVLQYKTLLKRIIKTYVDIVFTDEDTFTAFTDLPLEEGCLELQKSCPLVVVTLGEKGCLVGHDDQLIRVPTTPVAALDTTGAGDLFASGFLAGYLQGCDLDICARMGNLLGGAIVQITGAELPDNLWPALLQKLEKQGESQKKEID